MSLIIYYDFTSAESFALSEILRDLTGLPAVEWRGVQMDPTLPPLMRAFDRRALGRLEMEIEEVRPLVPGTRFVTPRGRPNTRRALQAVASVERMQAARAAALRRQLFQEYWWNGADLSNVATVRRIADAAGVPPWVELEHQAAQSTQVGWELQWQAERLGGVPRILRPDGQILWTIRDVATVRAFVTGAG